MPWCLFGVQGIEDDKTTSKAHQAALAIELINTVRDWNRVFCSSIFRLDVYGHIMRTGKSFPVAAMHSMTLCANF